MRSSKQQQQQQSNRAEQQNSAEVADLSLMNRDSFNSQIIELEMNLRNECDVLEMAMNFAGTSVPTSLHTEFNRLRAKVAEQIVAYQGMRAHRQSSSQLNMVKLSYNKIMLQFERIISSNPTIEEIANRFPRQPQQQNQPQSHQHNQQQQQQPSQVQQQQNQETLRSHPQPIAIQKNNINYYAPGDDSPDSSLKFSPLLQTQSQQQIGIGSVAVLSKILSKPPLTQTSFHSINASNTLANKRSSAQPYQSQTYLQQQKSSSSSQSQQILNNSSGMAATLTGEVIINAAKRESIERSNKDFIKRELIDIKTSLQSVAKKLDTHSHSEYELEIDYLQRENNSIMHDYKILKNDNTEIMHSLRTLSAVAQEIKLQNEQMITALDSNQRHLNQLKSFDHHHNEREIRTNNLPFQYQSEPNSQQSQQKNIIITRQDSRHKFQNSPNQNNKSQMSNPNNSTTRNQNSNALQNSRQKHIDSIRKLDFLESQQQQQQQSEYPEGLTNINSTSNNNNNNNNNNRVITRSSTRAAAVGANSSNSTSFPQSVNLFSDNQQQQAYQPASNKNSLRNSMPRQLIQEVKSSETEEENELLSSWARQRI